MSACQPTSFSALIIVGSTTMRIGLFLACCLVLAGAICWAATCAVSQQPCNIHPLLQSTTCCQPCCSSTDSQFIMPPFLQCASTDTGQHQTQQQAEGQQRSNTRRRSQRAAGSSGQGNQDDQQDQQRPEKRSKGPAPQPCPGNASGAPLWQSTHNHYLQQLQTLKIAPRSTTLLEI